MKILWANATFLHPTTKGGQIRTLETLRQLHRSHEIHYLTFADPKEPEGPAKSGEYCTRAHSFPLRAPDKGSLGFLKELAAGFVSSVPVSIRQYYSPEMAAFLQDVLLPGNFDRVVCDFLTPAPHFPDLSRVILFQHNVETILWRRRVEQETDALRRFYLNLQADRMFAYEGRVCRESGLVLAVSEDDARRMREMFGISHVAAVPTGVDVNYFAPSPGPAAPAADLVFVGSMDWAPNVDAMAFFVREILPCIRDRRPDCSLAVVGRSPGPETVRMAQDDQHMKVTGTVPDVRPYLWGSKISIVPLRIGGGTRLKIYEAMAAGVPVVSTRIGAEGLPVRHGEHLLLADSPEEFASACLALLENPARAREMSAAAMRFVRDAFSWEAAAREFEALLESGPQWKMAASAA
jgi:glycosyltransferase involved in cell wall biosynthesis